MELDDRMLSVLLDPLPTQWSAGPGVIVAAVQLLLVRRGDGDRVVFTERPLHLVRHPGQVSFPGGRALPGEAPLECALRETWEEIGAAPAQVDPLGGLPARGASSGYQVEVCVGRLDPDAELRPDPGEVARIFEVPMAHLCQPDHWGMSPPLSPTHSGRRPLTPHMRWAGVWIWGLTGRLTVDLLDRLQPGFGRGLRQMDPDG